MDFLTVALSDHVMTITLNRPEARNAFNRQMAHELEAALDALDADPAARVAILCSNHDVFCAGQDLKEAGQGALAVTERRGGFGIMARPPCKPIIAAIEGQALAGGFELALSCDLIVAARGAKFGLPEVKLGLVAIGGGCFRLPGRLPHHVAMEMILTGRPRSAEALQALGLVNVLAEPGGAVAAAQELARAVAANGPLAVQASKAIVVHSREEGWTDAEGWARQMDLYRPVAASADYTEGIRAFAEKRTPVWQGR